MDGKRKGLSGSDVVVARSGESITAIRLIRAAAAEMQYESQIETQRRGTYK
jgi:predicted RNA-binding protein YlqC (UPF0109 family)